MLRRNGWSNLLADWILLTVLVMWGSQVASNWVLATTRCVPAPAPEPAAEAARLPGLACAVGRYAVSPSHALPSGCMPTRLWLSILVQIFTVGLSLMQTEAICSTNAFVQPAMQRQFAKVDAAMDWLLAPLLLPMSLAVEHSPLGRFRCIVAFMQIVVGLFVVVGITAVKEAREQERWMQHHARLEPAGPEVSDAAGSGRRSRNANRWS